MSGNQQENKTSSYANGKVSYISNCLQTQEKCPFLYKELWSSMANWKTRLVLCIYCPQICLWHFWPLRTITKYSLVLQAYPAPVHHNMVQLSGDMGHSEGSSVGSWPDSLEHITFFSFFPLMQKVTLQLCTSAWNVVTELSENDFQSYLRSRRDLM